MDSRPEGNFTTRRPSLYTAIRLARLVQHFRERLKAKVKIRAQRNALLQSESNDLAQFQRQANARAQLRDCDSSITISSSGHASNEYHDSNWFCLLRRIDGRLSHPTGYDPIDTAARDDQLLLQFDAQRLISSRRAEQASNVLDNTTVLLERIQTLQTDEARRQQAAANHGFKDDIDFEKYLANVEHMLCSLQQAAIQALIRHSLEVIESDYKHWGHYLEQMRRFCDDWFSEWSSGRPPLSSTMPWNIKPSLLVLWGVCWMFYMANTQDSGPGQPREGTWMAQPLPQAGMQNPLAYSNDPMVPQQRRSSQMMRQRTGRSPPGLNTLTSRFGNIVGPGTTNPDLIGQLPASVFVGREMTHTSDTSDGHMTARMSAQDTRQAYTQDPRHDALVQEKLAAHAGVRTPVTAVPVAISDAALATPTSIWSSTPNQNQHPFVSHNPNDTGIWPQPSFGGDISSRHLSYAQPDSSVNPYAEHYDTITTAGPSQNIYASGPYGFATHFHQTYPSHLLPMTNQTYPISPRSEPSERASPLCAVTMPDNTSTGQPQTSPSIGQSSESRRDSISQTQDPPRNSYGQIYCEHAECAASPPIFSRKCEWSKHMDKHLRPYVCREPGCEKIRGFTYSGGLLRHEREVHRQHGGPKAPRFCPHKDCKRSTGQGFSRKENLNEHLRRVHRGVGIIEGKGESSSPKPPPSILPSQRLQDPPRKRRREEMEEEDEEEEYETKELMPGASGTELRAEIKRLRLELAQKEESIRRMRVVLQMPPTSM